MYRALQKQRTIRIRLGRPSRRVRPRLPASTAKDHHGSKLDPHAQPSSRELRALFLSSALPFVGFGLMDQTVMLWSGNAIDVTLGVMFGLSTLAAAAYGQICSNAAGVLFGGTVENIALRAGLPTPRLTGHQQRLPIVKRMRTGGAFFGVVAGCTLGLVNLLFIDTDRSSHLKLQALTSENEFSFQVEVSNQDREDITVVTVRGPDVDGVLASMASALTEWECSLVELSAKQEKRQDGTKIIEDVFAVVRGDHKIPDDELDDLAVSILEATKEPVNLHAFKNQVKELEDENEALRERVEKVETAMMESQITIRRTENT